MTLDEAIATLGFIKAARILSDKPDEHTAVQLGIEALKRCKVLARNCPLWAAKPLPGETTDD